ncbi:MAG: MOSC domain-containing protein [Terriglobales bacterium]
MPQVIATIAQLWLYPVKSMAGVSVEEAHVGLDGILGDRQYAFVRAEQAARNSFPWMTARESSRMLFYKPYFAQLPTPEQPEPAVRVRTPADTECEPGDLSLREELANELGQPLFLLKSARGMFDCQHLSLFSLASVRALAEEAGCPIDPRQFRANLFVEPASSQPFEEETWAGSLLQVGDQVLTGVTQRDPRCMMVNLDPESGKQDPRVLRAIAQKHQGQAGVYANVIRPGVIRVGDTLRLLTSS